ncbi:tumor necrosis factor receptor superfamily member 18 isoform X1 [Micropterus salmoides]|uniref:tumor necrosis factor receptor superfamily member 18 isoform X1 n=1 Tax=Micropterus salmoides TaxID=27706 RepID=UPI0018EA5517|nr:tumor necrosis factor receptor superfamily member 18 isoform X1 [Micropterus salmoides]
MIPLSLSLAVICVLSFWTIEYAAGCGDQQTLINGRCCNLCLPGTYMTAFCSEHQQTVCNTCEEGYYSSHPNVFDRCEECQSCQQGYTQKCMPTTNANCSCHFGFLCSNNLCSHCEENKCVTGEKLKRTVTSSSKGLIKYSYQCEPSCPDNAYFDVKEDVCKPRTQCSIEKFPGNKSHNAVCFEHETHIKGGDFISVLLGIGFVLLSLTLLVFLSHAFIKNLRKQNSHNNPIDIVTGFTSTNDFHLSKEESGLGLIMKDESMNRNSFCLLHLEKVTVS